MRERTRWALVLIGAALSSSVRPASSAAQSQSSPVSASTSASASASTSTAPRTQIPPPRPFRATGESSSPAANRTTPPASNVGSTRGSAAAVARDIGDRGRHSTAAPVRATSPVNIDIERNFADGDFGPGIADGRPRPGAQVRAAGADRPRLPDQPRHRLAALRRPAADRGRCPGQCLGGRSAAHAGQGPLGSSIEPGWRLYPTRRRRPGF